MKSKKNLIAVCLGLILAGSAFSQAPKGEEGPCKADAEKLCQGVEPGEGRIIKCLKEHEAELSAECKAKGLEVKKEAEGFKTACQSDLDALCKDVKEGEGRLLKCLVENKEKLSATCKTKMAEARGKIKKKNACAPDIEKLCKDVKEGEGRVIKCLKDNEKALSEACKAEMAAAKEKIKEKNPCLADLEKFCKDVKPGEGRGVSCLKEHEAELSEACKAKGLEVKKEAEGFKTACQSDLDTLCKDTKPGGGRLIKCLKDNEKALSEACKAEMAEGREKIKKNKAKGKGKGMRSAEPKNP